MARIAAGDREALHELYLQYRAPLFSLAVRMLDDFGAAEEALQDCFLKIWRGAAGYDARRSRPFTWAVTILRRGCIDQLRRRPPPSVPDSAESATDDVVRTAATAGETRERVKAALANLPDRSRAALELALFSGMTHQEIAGSLGEPLGTVKAWIRRGLAGLRGELEDLSP